MVLLGSVSASKTSGTDFFTSDLAMSTGRDTADTIIKITLRVATATPVKMTLDGSNYYSLYGGATLVADCWYFLEIPIISSDTINFKQDTGTMNVICRVHQ